MEIFSRNWIIMGRSAKIMKELIDPTTGQKEIFFSLDKIETHQFPGKLQFAHVK